jgi:hypothetical protein
MISLFTSRVFRVWTYLAIEESEKEIGADISAQLYRPSDRRISAKLRPTFADSVSRGQRNGSPRPLIQVTPQLSSRGRVDPVPDPLLLGRYGEAGNRTRDPCLCSQEI